MNRREISCAKRTLRFFLRSGSADSGVVTVSEASCRILNDDNSQRRDSAEEDPSCHRPRYCDPHRNPVERVLLEIVDTEAIYVEHLRQVIQVRFRGSRDTSTSDLTMTNNVEPLSLSREKRNISLRRMFSVSRNVRASI